MNSGLPSLLDAIFGKQDLDSVSLEEIHELITEFPSFNAGHFLLSKKLKGQQESDYEKETMRTALYFNNPFWLESVLNEERPLTSEKKKDVESSSVHSAEIGVHLKENTDTEANNEPKHSFQEQPLPEYTDGPVKSFDDLISKYHIESLTITEESFVGPQQEVEERVVDNIQTTDKTDSPADSHMIAAEKSEKISDDYEIREEVVNDYGIFEEVRIKKTDFDLEAFDRPANNLPGDDHISPVEPATEESPVAEESENALFQNEKTEESHDGTEKEEALEEPDAQRDRADYDAFDRNFDQEGPEETDTTPDLASEEESISEIFSGQDQRLESMDSPWESEQVASEITVSPEQNSGSDQLGTSTDSPEENQRSFSPFDPKKAESIVFAPYHMIDYFASQGIKLNLEENTADPLTRQLKSFTDWLKVMKKLPAQSIAEKTDEKEVDRVRHFAAHSIDEREILTESMAEVLAKQGMYENAIALFQKLSLIYPPKSAYFASRIEQIKASLP